jgi:hypothetical protein
MVDIWGRTKDRKSLRISNQQVILGILACERCCEGEEVRNYLGWLFWGVRPYFSSYIASRRYFGLRNRTLSQWGLDTPGLRLRKERFDSINFSIIAHLECGWSIIDWGFGGCQEREGLEIGANGRVRNISSCHSILSAFSLAMRYKRQVQHYVRKEMMVNGTYKITLCNEI